MISEKIWIFCEQGSLIPVNNSIQINAIRYAVFQQR